MTTVQMVAYLFGALVAFCTTLWGAFYITEKVVNDKYRKDFAQRVLDFDLKQWAQAWPREVLNIFDNMFGTKPLTWRFFSRSAACSVGFYMLVTIVYTSIHPDHSFQKLIHAFSGIATDIKLFPSESVSAGLFFMLAFSLITNAVADYISLLETRWMIRRLENNPTFRRIAIIFLADIVVTAVIFVMWISIWFLIMVLIIENEDLFDSDMGWLGLSIAALTDLPILLARILNTTAPLIGEGSCSDYLFCLLHNIRNIDLGMGKHCGAIIPKVNSHGMQSSLVMATEPVSRYE